MTNAAQRIEQCQFQGLTISPDHRPAVLKPFVKLVDVVQTNEFLWDWSVFKWDTVAVSS